MVPVGIGGFRGGGKGKPNIKQIVKKKKKKIGQKISKILIFFFY